MLFHSESSAGKVTLAPKNVADAYKFVSFLNDFYNRYTPRALDLRTWHEVTSQASRFQVSTGVFRESCWTVKKNNSHKIFLQCLAYTPSSVKKDKVHDPRFSSVYATRNTF
jgi:hypothetical protein